MVGSPQKNENQNNSNILINERRKVRNIYFASEKSYEPCSFSWEIVGDEDMKSWEMVEIRI